MDMEMEMEMEMEEEEETKTSIINEINMRIGTDLSSLSSAYCVENELAVRRDYLHRSLKIAKNEVPTKLSSAVKKAEKNSSQVQALEERSEQLKIKVQEFLNKTEPLRIDLESRYGAINKLQKAVVYLKTFEKIDNISQQMKQSNDDEQLVLLYGELKEMCYQYEKGHQAAYVKDCTRYWHNVLKDNLTKHYEDVLKLIQWPFSSGAEYSPPSKEAMMKFNNLTRYVFLIDEPDDPNAASVDQFGPDKLPCLPVKILLRPIKKRFVFHFTGTRQTARIDRPEWFLTQTLTWIKDHQEFVRSNVQPVADKLELKNVNAVDEFNDGLISLAAERLHTVLALYHSGTKDEIVDVDAAFAHAVDETLGFHKELKMLIGRDTNNVLSVLTKAETFIKWLGVEKKYALAKVDESLENPQWYEGVGAGAGAATGAALWVPRASDLFMTLLKTIEDRNSVLPQPGHRLQFLELQLELIEEWRVRLTQLMSAALETMNTDSFLSANNTSHPLTGVINAAHHTRTVLLQWAHSLHYLQLHYYRRQFQQFVQQNHQDEDSETTSSSEDDDDDDDYDSEDELPRKYKSSSMADYESDDAMSLKQAEARAKKLALNDVSRRTSLMADLQQLDITSPIANLAVTEPLSDDDDTEEAGVFCDAPALLGRLRDAGITAVADHILLEFKATFREYKRQKWHALLIVEEMALSVSSSLCRPLSGLCARMSIASQRLAPILASKLRAILADMIDFHIYEEVVLESWFNTGGTMQFTHDVKRNLVPTFVPPNKLASQVNPLARLTEACKLLNLDYEDARRVRATLSKQSSIALDTLHSLGITNIPPAQSLRILNQRTDLSDTNSPSSVMELF